MVWSFWFPLVLNTQLPCMPRSNSAVSSLPLDNWALLVKHFLHLPVDPCFLAESR